MVQGLLLCSAADPQHPRVLPAVSRAMKAMLLGCSSQQRLQEGREGLTSFMSQEQLQHFWAPLPTEQTNSSYLINSVSKGEYCYLRSSVNLKYSLIS